MAGGHAHSPDQFPRAVPGQPRPQRAHARSSPADIGRDHAEMLRRWIWRDLSNITLGFGRERYGGPCPPSGHGPHRYLFKVYALDEPSLALAGETRQDLEKALETHALGSVQLMGRCERARQRENMNVRHQ